MDGRWYAAVGVGLLLSHDVVDDQQPFVYFDATGCLKGSRGIREWTRGGHVLPERSAVATA